LDSRRIQGELLPPDPHPLDYDWRFDQATVEELCRRVSDGRTLFVGCPSVARGLAKRDEPCWLIDRQPLFDHSPLISQVEIDLRYSSIQPLSTGMFDNILIDSPWYMDFVFRWIAQSYRHLAPHGRLLFSLWPAEVRPSGFVERQEVLEYASKLGLVTVHERALGYVTPPFERASAAVTGRTLGDNRRRGDLVIVHSSGRSVAIPAGAEPDPPRACWERFIFGRKQVALRVDTDEPSHSPRLVELTPGGVLPDVSRRLALRQEIDLWTSDNVALKVEGRLSILGALDALASGRTNVPPGPTSDAINLLLERGIVSLIGIGTGIRWRHYD
jgi:hypothetical protein